MNPDRPATIETGTPFPRLAATLFDGRVRTAEGSIQSSEAHLYPEELAHIATARPVRREQFATGRLLAHRALAELGVEPAPLLAGPQREPIWPSGVVGSITHTDDYCAVAVARAAEATSLGIDAEPDAPLEAELWPTICTAAELDWLATQQPAERGFLARLIFSAKECGQKCHFPLTRRILEFSDAEIAIDQRLEAFEVAFLVDAGAGFAPGLRVSGRFARSNGLLVTAITLPRP